MLQDGDIDEDDHESNDEENAYVGELRNIECQKQTNDL